MEMIDVVSEASQEVDFDNVQDAIRYATLIFAAAMPSEQYSEYTKSITSAHIACPETNRFYRLNLQAFNGQFNN